MRKTRDIPENLAALSLAALIFAVAVLVFVILGDFLGGILASLAR